MPLRRTRSTPEWTRPARYLVPAAFIIALLGLFVVGFAIGAALGAFPQGQPWRSGQGAPGTQDSQNVPRDAAPGEVATADRTVFSFITVYRDCGCVVRESKVAGPELAGLSEAALAGSFPGWSVQRFELSQVELFRTLPGMCPEMSLYRTIGLSDGLVAVYYGRPASGLLLERVTGVDAAKLPQVDQARLATGIVVQGDEAVERYLEGLPE